MKNNVNLNTEKNAYYVVCEIIENNYHNLEWTRIKSQNCYYSQWFNHNGENYRLLKSYSTVVGLQNNHNGLWEMGKYSQTTSKQVTQFCNNNGLDKHFVENLNTNEKDKLIVR